jgi:hypothetical protein
MKHSSTEKWDIALDSLRNPTRPKKSQLGECDDTPNTLHTIPTPKKHLCFSPIAIILPRPESPTTVFALHRRFGFVAVFSLILIHIHPTSFHILRPTGNHVLFGGQCRTSGWLRV